MITECKCGNPVQAKLDPDTNKVICQSCKKEIENISEFAKNNMRAQGDIIRPDGGNIRIPKGGMMVECNALKEGKICGHKFVALLEKKNEECYCPKCKEKVTLSSFSKALLRENGQYIGMVHEESNVEEFDIEVAPQTVVVGGEAPKKKRGRPPKVK